MKCFLLVTDCNGLVECHRYYADDLDHALEQFDDEAEDYNARQFITHSFVSDSDILNTNEEERGCTPVDLQS